ncbi:WD40-repeat-containing domain protein [Aspergillus pseudonomiae]|uniref:WD40-repeat-containing domain protein n=1 Tax=Aspergillus pseudonomiae TaxID=1506151 RepID=A0A5N7DUW2_9EURO|nr:WD40-repeat-containing domain protein [Aspergillus pseudonomiae]KAE8409819.1 WD40-repeat-containing domain protein [Aspergillus pseudonomiae]
MTASGVTNSAPICVASTRRDDEACDASLDSHSHDTPSTACGADKSASDTNFVKSVEWTPDGTTLLTDSADYHIRTYILPPDLLEERPSPHRLSPYSVLPSAEPTYAAAIYPYYSLQDPATTLFLSSVRDHPIRLASTLAPTLLATYSLIHPTTEAFITPHSIIYPHALGGTHFLTGSDSLICLFDVSRPGNDGPVSWMPTIPSKRKQTVGGGVGMKGIISAMAINPTEDGILAAGTFSRQVGLYDSNGTGQSLGTFSIAKTDASHRIGGRGITQLLWSPCGRYLYIAERKSDGVMIYDIRVTGQLLGWLEGRKAITNQRMKVDIVSTNQGTSHEIWGGGTDGFMRVWRDPTHTAGGQEPVSEWKIHNDSVSSTVLHPMGNVVATCAGQRHYSDDDGSSSREKPDNSVKVWSMPFL